MRIACKLFCFRRNVKGFAPLIKHRFTVVNFATKSLKESVELATNADIIAGVHGASLVSKMSTFEIGFLGLFEIVPSFYTLQYRFGHLF